MKNLRRIVDYTTFKASINKSKRSKLVKSVDQIRRERTDRLPERDIQIEELERFLQLAANVSKDHFTLLCEALVMSLAKAMPTRSLAKHVGEHDTRLWRVVNHHVEEARTSISFADVASFGVDETASKRGHNYVTVFAKV